MKNYLYIILAALIVLSSCVAEEDDVAVPAAPTASFTAVPSADNPNLIILTNTSQNGGLAVFDFPGSDGVATSAPVMAALPFIGSYTITMTAIGPGGTSTAEQIVDITTDDPNAASPTQLLLVGDPNNPKRWRASRADGAFGVGPGTRLTDSGLLNPSDPIDQSWFSAPANVFDGSGDCTYEDTYQFTVSSFENGGLNIEDADGNVRWNWTWANGELGESQPEFSDICFPANQPDNIQYTIERRTGSDGEDGEFLVMTPGTKIVYYEGISTFHIARLTETELVLRFGNADFDASQPNNNAEGGGGWRTIHMEAVQ